MPYKNKPRPYKKEWKQEQARDEKKSRAARARARRLLDKKLTDREKCELANKKFIDDFVHANSSSVQHNITKTITYIINNFETLKQ